MSNSLITVNVSEFLLKISLIKRDILDTRENSLNAFLESLIGVSYRSGFLWHKRNIIKNKEDALKYVKSDRDSDLYWEYKEIITAFYNTVRVIDSYNSVPKYSASEYLQITLSDLNTIEDYHIWKNN